MEVSTSPTSVAPSYPVEKTRFASEAGAWDKSTIRYNDHITLTGIPGEAHEHGDPEHILNLLKRMVTVSVETVAIVKAPPALRIREAKRP